jgi:hypothetical protein
MSRRVALARTDLSDERSASIIRVTRIGELGTTLAVISNKHAEKKYCYKHTKYYVSHIVFLRRVRRLPVTANVVPSSQIIVTLMMEALRSSGRLVLARATRRDIPEDGILHVRFALRQYNSGLHFRIPSDVKFSLALYPQSCWYIIPVTAYNPHIK